MSYFILTKGKKAKQWSGAIPAAPNATRSQLENLIKKTLKTRYSAKIITKQQFLILLKKSSVRLKGIKKTSIRRRKK